MIDPLTVLIATPAYDGKVETAFAGGLMACAAGHLFGNIVFLNDCCGVQLARDLIAEGFLRSNYEWLVFIDADIGFSVNDFRLLLGYPTQPGDTTSSYPDESTKIDVMPPHREPLISCAEYSRKVPDGSPARFGLGFCKIHRSVFSALDALSHENGAARVQSFRYQGRSVTDYFIAGAIDGTWMGEDTGFFHLVRLVGIIPRIETRTRLIHVGKQQYPYRPLSVSA